MVANFKNPFIDTSIGKDSFCKLLIKFLLIISMMKKHPKRSLYVIVDKKFFLYYQLIAEMLGQQLVAV